MKHSIFNLFLFISLILTLTRTYAQSVDDHSPIPLINAPEPNSVGIMKTIETPAASYTGVPSISIPLYQIKMNGLNVPIHISYDASGIKVAQEATWVGLGWNLNVGGTITRIIRGVDDFGLEDYNESNGPTPGYYYYDKNEPDNESELFINYGTGTPLVDCEPDIFYYSFCGYSGKFIIDGSNKEEHTDLTNCIKLDQNNLRIYIIDKENIEITNDVGIKFLFSKGNEMRSFSQSSDYYYAPGEEIIYDINENYSEKYTSSWKLDKIIFPNSEEINFYYNSGFDMYKSPMTVSKKDIKTLMMSGYLINQYSASNLLSCINYNEGNDSYIYSWQQNYSTSVLDSIVTPIARVEFDANSRDDVGGNLTGQKVQQINVYDRKTGCVKKTWDFYYSYFNQEYRGTDAVYLMLRLKLDSLQETGKAPYVFSYNENIQLPAKNSPSVDHWGYYNGKTNTYHDNEDGKTKNFIFSRFSSDSDTKLPDISINLPDIGDNASYDVQDIINNYDFYIDGADRLPSEVHAKAAILEQIKFPTGSSRIFNYESNKIAFEGRKASVISRRTDITVSDDTPEITTTFEILKNQEITFHISLFQTPESTVDPTFPVLISDIWTDNYEGLSPSSSFTTWIEPGVYNITLKTDGSFIAKFQYWEEETIFEDVKEKDGPGLRVNSIEDLEKKVYYTYSGGKLLSEPTYIMSYFVGGCNTGNHQPVIDNVNADYPINLMRYSSSIRPLAGFGGTLGYDKVNSFSIVNEDTISTVKYFHNLEEKTKNYRLPNLPNEANHSNGLIKKIEYRKNREIVKEESFIYEKDQQQSKQLFAMAFDLGVYSNDFYINNSEWWKLKQKIVAEYYGNNNIRTFTQYTYNPYNYSVEAISTENSQGDTLLTRTLYEDTQTFKDRNMISLPSRVETTTNERLTSGTAYSYNQIGLPTKLYKADIPYGATNGLSDPDTEPQNLYPYKLEQSYIYGSNNKLSNVLYPENYKIAYYWSYNNTYPVVKAVGISNTELNSYVSNAANSSGLSISDWEYNPRTNKWSIFNQSIRNEASDALIYTYTYDPLVGMTSETDPNGLTTHYEYDDFGRLKCTRDDDGNIINTYKYHYAGEGE